MRDLFGFEHPNVWTALRECDEPIVLYGMGNGADKALAEFEKRGIRAAGVMASDDFVRYQDYRGYTVKKESDFEKELGSFTVALCFGSSLSDVMEHIHEVGSRRRLLVPNVPVAGDNIIDDGFINRYREDIEAAFSLLADDKSREVYKLTLDFYYTGMLRYLRAAESDKDEAFGNILRLKNESYLDLGAYRGDTVDEFLSYTDGYTQITAVEPNPKNFKKLSEHIADIDRSRALNAGISDTPGVMKISKKAGRMPVLNDSEGIVTAVTTVDEIDCAPTYIKVDIEGSESAMLRGAEHTLRALSPKLNLAAYHRSEDFFSLILQLHSIEPDYKIYLRKHPYIPMWDLNIYAVKE